MAKARLTKINEAINNRDRPNIDYYGGPLYGCDVCWTCKHFNVQISSCTFGYQDALEIVGAEGVYEKEYYIVPVPIKDPSYYRCSAWKGR